MKLALDYILDVGDDAVASASILQNLDQHREALGDVGQVMGHVAVSMDGVTQELDYSEPLVRLVEQFLTKVPWILGGDTETVALRYSEQCFAFIPAGDSVEFSFFNGSEAEVDDYVLEPTVVRVDALVEEILRLGDRLVELISAASPEAFESDEDCRDLRLAFDEAHKSWREHQRRQRY